MSEPLHRLGVAALGRVLRDRSVSSVELTSHLLDRLAAHEHLGVTLAVDADRALEQARAADARLVSGSAGTLTDSRPSTDVRPRRRQRLWTIAAGPLAA